MSRPPSWTSTTADPSTFRTSHVHSHRPRCRALLPPPRLGSATHVACSAREQPCHAFLFARRMKVEHGSGSHGLGFGGRRTPFFPAPPPPDRRPPNVPRTHVPFETANCHFITTLGLEPPIVQSPCVGLALPLASTHSPAASRRPQPEPAHT